MKRKIFAIISSAVCLVSMCLLFLPLDFSYIYMAEILLSEFFIPLLIRAEGFTPRRLRRNKGDETRLRYLMRTTYLDLRRGMLIVNCAMTKKKMALCMTILQTASLLAFVVFAMNFYSYFSFGWKLNLILYFVPQPFLLCVSLKVFGFGKRFVWLLFGLIMASIFIKSMFFSQFYFFRRQHKENLVDIRDYSFKDNYKILGLDRLKRNNVAALSSENIDIIFDVLKESDWISEHYPYINFDVKSLDRKQIERAIKYDFSLIDYYNLEEVDVYKLRIPFKRQNVYVYIPFGKFVLFEEGLRDYRKYTSHSPKRLSSYCYLDLLIPFYDIEWYTANMKN